MGSRSHGGTMPGFFACGLVSHGGTMPGLRLAAPLVLVATGPGFRDEASMEAWNRNVRRSFAERPLPDEAAGLLMHTDSWVIDHLGDIAHPTVQIVGEQDEMFLRSTNYMATKLAGPVTTRIVAGAGHHVHRHRPAAVNDAIEALPEIYSRHIDPKEVVRIQREGRGRGEDIIGFYHSHPDHPARWSQTDLAEAYWIGCSYVITSVEKGKAVLTNSFELTGSNENDKKMADEKIEVT